MAGLYPVPNATIPYWRTELHELDSHRSTAELPKKQDIVIIGAGFAGAALAHYLLKDNASKPSVTILEAREACSGATGRNGGQLRPNPFVDVAVRMQAQGLETANQVARFEAANARAVVELVGEERIACDLRAVTTADAFVDAGEAARIRKLWDAMAKLDCPTLRDVAFHGAEDAERVTGVKGAKVAFTYPAHLLWPYKLVMHILAGAVRDGANLQTHTPVHEVSETPDVEGYWTVATSRGPAKARRVLFATNAYTSGLLPEYDDAIYAARGTVARVVPSSSSSSSSPSPPLGSCALQLKSPALVDSYYGLRADGSFIVGGARSAYGHLDSGVWYRNFDDATLIQPAVPFFDGWAGRTFVGWEGEGEGKEAKAKVESVWTGIMGYSADSAPHIGPVPSKPGLYVCAGFNGHGMPNVLLCAKGLAAMVRDGCAFADTGVPACYETGAERLRKIAEGAEVKTTGRARADIYLKY
ncbi:FAD dependent oxidoreductase [Hypoxylon cercidicola]|nr:FAD dependent oxidoreductase [Hypoxylon cercidicola]